LVWRALVISVLQGLGGKATLPQIYAKAEGRRPTPNVWWREKIRQMLCTTTDIHENDGLWCYSPAI
jgi:site-specific DNA-methyltransferase (adenine-specific)